MESKLIPLFAALLIPMLLPIFIRKFGIKVPAKKWAVWYAFWIFLAFMVAFQIYTIEHILVVEPDTIRFGAGENRTSIFISNNGSGVIKWSIETNASYLLFDPQSDSVAGGRDEVLVELNRSALGPQTRTGKFLVVGESGERSEVTVEIGGG